MGSVWIPSNSPPVVVSAAAYTPMVRLPRLWLRTDLGVPADTGAWDAWYNQGTIGSGLDVLQATGAKQPTYDATGGSNSKPMLTFDGSNDMMVSTGAGWTGGSCAHTSICVVKAAPAADYDGFCSLGSLAVGNSTSTIGLRNDDLWWFGGQSQIDPTGSAGDDEWHFMAKTVTGGASPVVTAWKDGVAETLSGSFAQLNMSTNVFIGGYIQTNFAPFALSEWLAWDRVLSASELSEIFAYLAVRYAL